MEDIFGLLTFIICVVFAVVGAVSKKKSTAKQTSVLTSTLTDLLEDDDLPEKEDDNFIPSVDIEAPEENVEVPKAEVYKSPAESYRPMQTAEVNNTRPISVPAFEEKEPLKVVETPSVCNEIRQELEDAETLRRAVIYQEILTPKFKNS